MSYEGIIVLMGSGELTPTMVPTHREILQKFNSARAVFIDTPAGFQLNVDQISQKAKEYFQIRLQTNLEIVSFKSAETTNPYQVEAALHQLRNADYVLVGPGSPSYAVRQWNQSKIPITLRRIVEKGSCLVAASAASLTVGRFTLPVYEIYKVGESPHWLKGLDLLSHFGLNLVVIPHWNNAEGGNHDTRFCYMGLPRYLQLEALLPEDVGVIGLDEHTACILDFKTQYASVTGIGSVTFRLKGSEFCFQSGSRFPFSVLKGEDQYLSSSDTEGEKSQGILTQFGGLESKTSDSPPAFWDSVRQLETTFKSSLKEHKGYQALNALLALDQSIWTAYESSENSELISQAREVIRELLVLLGAHIESLPKSKEECLKPVVESLLDLREKLRQEGQWPIADSVREILAQSNITVEDTRDGPTWNISL